MTAAGGEGATDAADAAAAGRGDVRAFERLYHRHIARIHTLTRRMLGPGEADDATQDIFVRAWTKIGTFRGDSAFGTWLYRLGVNVILARRATLAIQRGRFAANTDDHPDHAAELAAPAPPPPEIVMDFEAALERLPPGMREVVVLHDVEGYKHEEIARMLGVSAGTSKSQLHRGRMALRKYLDG
jgi:RNA polymerase sigma-70 factor, ECF subfamily